MQENNVQRSSRGLNQDSSLVDQNKETFRFALNAINESNEGDFAFISNEQSNEVYTNIPSGFTPIGKAYMDKNEVALLLVSNEGGISEIGILGDNNNYTTHVNDADVPEEDKLNFHIAHQIQAVYRLRRGCERTIYFTDDYNKPRYYNFDKPEEFKTGANWKGKKFNLFKEYNKVPKFETITVENSGGNLEPGTYNIAIQYLDEGLNPTEWITTSPIINIYNDSTTENFLNIRGSINSESDYLDFPTTSKSIRVSFSNLDENFMFYRLAFVEASNGVGLINKVKLSEVIPTTKNFFLYTGTNAASEGTKEEIAFFNEVVEKAQSIEQIENRLVLGNTEGKQVNFCKLQKYASKIKADCFSQPVIMNNIHDPRSPKNPTVHFGDGLIGGVGYMPGEIYSFGIVYVFEDGSISPVYHIPGKSPNVDEQSIFSPEVDANGKNIVFPMSTNNQSKSNRYIDNSNCGTENIWGLDSEGVTLQNRYVRHHRFPYRSEIGLPMVETASSTGVNTAVYYRMYVTAKANPGDLKPPCTQEMIEAGECSSLYVPEPFDVRITYSVAGVESTVVFNIDPAINTGGDGSMQDVFNTGLYTDSNITPLKVEETKDGIDYVNVPLNGTNGPTSKSPNGLVYSFETLQEDYSSESKLYRTFPLGIKFSGIELPSPEDTGGEEVIGYYIVRNERIEDEKTILDSAALTHTMENRDYISTGLLFPRFPIAPTKFNKNVLGMIHPEHKFNNKEYTNYSFLKLEGLFQASGTQRSKIRHDDVLDGTSYNSKYHKSGNSDGDEGNGDGPDGWSLTVAIRDNELKYTNFRGEKVNFEDLKESFYLKAVESRDINNGANTVYNVSSDNRIGIIQTSNAEFAAEGFLPYVLIGREINDSYSNFRSAPYYKQSINIETGDTSKVMSGDVYITPMRYVNTVFWENRPAFRVGRKSLLKTLVGVIAVVVGAVLAFFTAGATTLIIGAGIALIGAGALYAKSGIEQDAFNKAYNEEYDKGLRETSFDEFVQYTFRNPNRNSRYKGPWDDDIEWVADCLTDLWFESTVNISLRNGMTSNMPTFLDAPGKLESGNNKPDPEKEFFKYYYDRDITRNPISKLEFHISNKLTVFDSSRQDNKSYLGAALGEYYEVNPDYTRYNKEKPYFHLPLEYDCCSDCMEDFPHRVHYSEQSFQEELTDNYRVFLPNNYRDIQGETGEIKNIFKIGNNLYIHTLEALWNMPRSYQERVTDQIVSFIGTGSYFEIPPQKIMDDETGMSAGTQHKWSGLKTPRGYFFVSENQQKIFQFDGQALLPISSNGLSNWFRHNIPVQMDLEHMKSTGKRDYPFADNPSNPLGSGFISTYDSEKERILFTKKDFTFSPEVTDNEDYQICTNGGEFIIFKDFEKTKQEQALQDWHFVGIESCEMKFQKEVEIITYEERQIEKNVFKDVDYIVFRYNFSDGKDLDTRTKLIRPFVGTDLGWCQPKPESTGINPMPYMRWGGDNTGQGIESILLDIKKFKEDFPGNNEIEFIAKAWWYRDRESGDMNMNAEGYKGGTMTINQYNFVNSGGILQGDYDFPTVNITKKQSDCVDDPDTIGNFIYNIEKGELSWNGTSGGDIPSEIEYETIIVEVKSIGYEYKTIPGTVITNPLQYNGSWTMSYSLKSESWVSWHSYMPNFYINVPQKFYSWVQGNDTIYRHNAIGNYQTFYGKYYPHILEYVAVSNPLPTKIWNHIQLQTDAREYKPSYEDFVESRYTTFNKLVLYNSRQCSGLLNLKVKDVDYNQVDFFNNQTQDLNNNDIVIDRVEKDWLINDLRDIRVDYNTPIWNYNPNSLVNEYYIDKILNTSTMNVNKDWTQLESFRDKYLVVRLIFDSFVNKTSNVKLVTNYTIENEQVSFR